MPRLDLRGFFLILQRFAIIRKHLDGVMNYDEKVLKTIDSHLAEFFITGRLFLDVKILLECFPVELVEES